jgi:CBS domain-containing protein
MLARDVMAKDPATTAPHAPLHAVASAMVEGGATGLPVVDASRRLLGLVTECDLLHRLAAAEEGRHWRLRDAFRSTDEQADEYARSHGCLAADVMTPAAELVTATEDTTAEHLARVMEERRVRHLPVVRAGHELAGMVTRALLLRAALRLPEPPDARAPDDAIRDAVLRAMRAQPWADRRFTFVKVADGVVTYSGLVRDDHVKRGLRALANGTPGVGDVVFATKPTPRVWIGAS